MGILGAIIIGFITGIIAKLITPGDPKPRGFILTALLATWLGQAIGWYESGEAAGFLGAIVGSVIVLLIWRQLANPR